MWLLETNHHLMTLKSMTNNNLIDFAKYLLENNLQKDPRLEDFFLFLARSLTPDVTESILLGKTDLAEEFLRKMWPFLVITENLDMIKAARCHIDCLSDKMAEELYILAITLENADLVQELLQSYPQFKNRCLQHSCHLKQYTIPSHHRIFHVSNAWSSLEFASYQRNLKFVRTLIAAGVSLRIMESRY
jgi:hypothetical protein